MPELLPATESIRCLYGLYHSPFREVTRQIDMSELFVPVNYDVVVDDIGDLLIDFALIFGVVLRD